MAEHNAVIYVYCDFNLKPLRPDSVLECNGDVCNGLCHEHNRRIYTLSSRLRINNSTAGKSLSAFLCTPQPQKIS
jgi:hypothetical protein